MTTFIINSKRRTSSSICDVQAGTQAEYPIFHIPRHDIASAHHRELRDIAMQTWRDIATFKLPDRSKYRTSLVLGTLSLQSQGDRCAN
jgi:hypothetical protein